MIKDIYQHGRLFYQIFTRYLPDIKNIISLSIDSIRIYIYHFTQEKKNVREGKMYPFVKTYVFLYLLVFRGKIGKMCKKVLHIMNGTGKNLVKYLVKIYQVRRWNNAIFLYYKILRDTTRTL